MKKTSSAKNLALLVVGISLVAGGGAFYVAGPSDDAPAQAPEAVLAAELPAPNPDLPVMKVWKSPTCGCCSKWVEHVRQAGFEVQVEDVQDIAAVKGEHGVAAPLQSCHTALVDGYVVEGHVPAEDIVRLLEERPEVAGLAAPGMPMGSPGMEMGDHKDAYDVLAFDREGKTSVWASHGK